MKKILLISDNHGWVDPAVLHHALWADEVWHAGDWLNMDLFTELEKLNKPIRGVWGNADGMELRRIFKEVNFFHLEGMDFFITHIGGYPGKYNPKIKEQLFSNPPHVFICGHSHILKVARDPKLNNMLCLNPGACGLQGFHEMRTALRFILDNGKITALEIIEIGLKSAVKGPYPWQ
jgi:putative phosphoesterase